MRRQVTNQQRRERQLLHLQDSSHQQLKETGTKLKWQAAAVRGGYDYQQFKKPKGVKSTLTREKKVSDLQLSPYKLPSVGKAEKSKQKNVSRYYVWRQIDCACVI